MRHRYWRMYRSGLGCLLSLLLLFGRNPPGLAGQADVADFRDVRIYTDDDPPYVIVDGNNAITGGITVERIFKTIEKLNLPASSVKAFPWARAYNLAKTMPNVMIFPIVKTRERLQYLNFTFKIIDAKVYFYKLKTRTDISLKSLEDAKKYTICVVLNDYRHEYLKDEGFQRLDPTSDSTVNVQRFMAGRCDLAVLTEIGIQGKLRSLHQNENLVVKILELEHLDSAMYAAFNKNTSPVVIKAFRDAAAAVR